MDSTALPPARVAAAPAPYFALTAVFAALIALLLAPAPAHAQGGVEPPIDPGRLALMPSSSGDPSVRELATALNPVVLAQLEAVAHVTVAARPALDLPGMQLAIDCMGETPECLRAVSAQSATDSLLAPSVQRAGEETVVTLLYFDARGAGQLRSVVARYTGPDIQRAALDAVPNMLRELFAIAEPVPAQPLPAEQEPLDESAIEPQAEPVEHPFPVGPVIVGAAGLVLIGVGTAFGIAAKASQKDYEKANPETMPAVDKTLDDLDGGKTQALLCNVGLAVGGAALVTGVVWLLVELSGGDGSEQVALTPRVAPGTLGVTLAGEL